MAYIVDWHPRVKESMATAPKHVKDEFEKLLRTLVEHPRPSQTAVGALPLQEGMETDEFTAPFDDALLVYRILPLADYRVIRLVLVMWL